MLLAAGKPAEAEAAYREELQRNPDNGWSLYGLAQSLRAQKREAEAKEVEGASPRHGRTPTSSSPHRACEPRRPA